ncbi:MAG: hypothetical protein KC518_13460 [Candidatus Cloacimonetes bacterium]|nr:hypothetical protein [Candidatus Cloacimonadota bacterium]
MKNRFLKSLLLLLPLAAAEARSISPLDHPADPQLRLHAGLDWLLERDRRAPAASWPAARSPVLSAESGPRSSLASQDLDSNGLARWAPARWTQPDLALALAPVLTVRDWKSRESGMQEAGNGLDLEALWLDQWAVQLSFRDAQLTGDLAARNHPGFERSTSWLWQETSPDGRSLTHDETLARLGWAHALGSESTLRVSIGREQPTWGPGLLGGVILRGERAPGINLFRTSLDSGDLAFTFIMAELESQLVDSLALHADPVRVRQPWRQKWLVGHRLDLRGKSWAAGLGELVVVGDEFPGPGYLNPVNFLWSEQHASGDRDNTLLFADLRVRLPRWLPGPGMLYGELSMDDYTLGDFGSDAEGQKTATLLGLAWAPPLEVLNPLGGTGRRSIWFIAEQRRIRPWFGSHFHQISSYTHGGQSLMGAGQPNSRLLDLALKLDQRTSSTRIGAITLEPGLLGLSLEGGQSLHGANPPGLNIGGRIDEGHREGIDPDHVRLLEGILERQDWRRLRLDCRQPLSLVFSGRQRPAGVLQLDLAVARWNGHALAPGGEWVREFRIGWSSGSGTP